MIALWLVLAAAPLPEHSLVYTNLFAARLNPLGVTDQLRLAYRHRLFDSESPLFQPANFSAGVTTELTPANARFGPSLELTPLAALQLYAAYEFVGYFGVLQNVLALDSPEHEVSDATRAALAAARQNRPMAGGRLTLSILVQAKVGPIAVRAQLQFFRYDMRGQPGENVFYEPGVDMLVPMHGFFLQHDADVLYVTNFGLIAGVRHSLAHSLEDAPRVSPGFGGLNSQHRVGPIALYEFFNRPGAAFDRPSLGLIVQWYLQHRYRTGQETTQAFPQIVLAFLFAGELWRK
ncbi:MAG: hypothetical protein IT381_23245 [Deltaproteobacteria bacterium]|nr:hypothetical protein [Deltaproteobacteria bacterium]